MSNFHPLEVVGRGSETQLQVNEKLIVYCNAIIIRIIIRINHTYWKSHECLNIIICKCLVLNRKNMKIFHPLEVVGHGKETQLEVDEKLIVNCSAIRVKSQRYTQRNNNRLQQVFMNLKF